jgi:DNA primase
MHLEATSLYRRALLGPDGEEPRSYLAERGLGHVLNPASVWQVGYAPPGWTTLTNHLRRLDYSAAELLAAGLAVRARTGNLLDRFRDRISVPIRDTDGNVVAFIARSAPHAGTRVAKYLNSPTTPIYRKGESLFGLSEQRQVLLAGANPVLVEGPMDVLAVAEAAKAGARPDDFAAVAACGTALTAQQATLLAESVTPGSDIVVAFDADPAGASAAANAYQTLRDSDLVAMGELLSARLPKGLDPADLLRVHGPAALRAALTDNLTPLVDQAIDTRLTTFARVLDGADGRIAAAKSVADLLSTVRSDQAARYVVRIARLLDLDPMTVSIAVTDAITASTNPRAMPRPQPVQHAHASAHGGHVRPPV